MKPDRFGLSAVVVRDGRSMTTPFRHGQAKSHTRPVEAGPCSLNRHGRALSRPSTSGRASLLEGGRRYRHFRLFF